MSGKKSNSGGTHGTIACAACKHRRSKCDKNCAFAPYFPANRPKDFQNVNKLFGISNILKIMNSILPSQKPIAMQSIIFQAKARRIDPIHGCLSIIQNLNSQIGFHQKELDIINQQLSYCRMREQMLQQQQMPYLLTSLSSSSSLMPDQMAASLEPLNKYSNCPSLQEYEDIKPLNVKFIAQECDNYHYKKADNLKDVEQTSAEPMFEEKESVCSFSSEESGSRDERFTATSVIVKKEKEVMETNVELSSSKAINIPKSKGNQIEK